MQDDPADTLRAELTLLGERRKLQQQETEALARDTRKAVKRAKGVITMSEVARLVGLDRTSLYQTYG